MLTNGQKLATVKAIWLLNHAAYKAKDRGLKRRIKSAVEYLMHGQRRTA